MNRQLPAFTLLELLAVVALLALAAALVGTKLGNRGRARLQQAEETLRQADRWVRQLAEQQRKAIRLRIFLNKPSLQVESATDGANQVVRHFHFPDGITLRRVLSSHDERSAGEMVILYDRQGASDTFAIELESSRGEHRWLFVVGGTGQASVVVPTKNFPAKHAVSHYNENDIESFFRTLQKKRFYVD